MVEYLRFFREAWETLQAMNGAGGLTIAALLIQLVMKYLNSRISDRFSGAMKLLVVSGLSFAGAIVAGLTAGSSLWVVIMSGPVLAAMQVFVHQVLKYISGEPDGVETKEIK